ncbi:MAG TPA: dephospho-CoA kinase [Afifellaceae bacterium]|nr:dephospho-CoA kinase [Afifellaceae bacterium]
MDLQDQKRPLRIGLTGGIASGKSVVAAMFAELGAQIIDTDVIAREVVEPSRPALDDIRQRFGSEVLAEDGRLDRGTLRQIVFSDEAARKDLESILHPRIGDETRRQAAELTGDYPVIVVPLLVGSPLRQFVDRIVVVDCDEKTQMERLLSRDAETVAQARRMIAAQASRNERLAIADDVVDNSGDLNQTRKQVEALDTTYRQLTGKT